MRPVRDQRIDRRLRQLILAADSRAENEICGIVEHGVKKIAHRFFYPGAEYEDVVQWGMIGVVSGIRSYSSAADTGPEVYSWLLFCAQRSIVTGLKMTTRDKHRSLNEARSIEQPVYNRHQGEALEEPFTLHDVLADRTDTVELLADRERITNVIQLFRYRLTEIERTGLLRAVNGEPYSRHETGSKSLENAVDRARRKLREAA